MPRPPYDDDQELTPASIRRAMQELKDMGLIVDSGRRRNGQIVWITREQAELKLKRN